MKLPSLITRVARVLPALALGGAVGLTRTVAQTVSSSVKAGEEVVELSPFVVNASEDNGYQAANTLAGSRMNTSLKDTAASVSIMTAEFLEDIGALNLDEAVAFGNNVELDFTNASDDNGGTEFFTTYRIRGQAATIARNYFTWKLPTNIFNVERIEEDRGPNAVLFGVASAGGMLSTQTKQAFTNRNFRRARLLYGSYDLQTASVDINQSSLNGKLGVRFNAVASDSQGYQHYEFSKDNRVDLALTYKVGSNTVVRAEYENGKTSRQIPMSQEVKDQVLKWIAAGRPLVDKPVANTTNGIALAATSGNQSVTYVENDGTFQDKRGLAITQGLNSGVIMNSPLVDNTDFTINVAGPGQTQATNFNAVTVSVDHKLGASTYISGAYNHQDYDFSAWQAFRVSGLQGDPNRYLKDGVTPNPHAGELYFDTEWLNRLRNERMDNYRLTMSHRLDLGKWGDYRFAALAERQVSFWEKRNYNTVWGNPTGGKGGAYNATTTNAANTVKFRHYITEGDFASYYASIASPGTIGYFSDVPNPLVANQKISARATQQNITDFSDPSEQDSFLASAQAYYLKQRLIFAGGYRSDTLYLHNGFQGAKDPVTNDNIVDNVNYPRTNRTIRGNTRTFGVVYHVLPWLALRYNNSNSFELPNTGVAIMSKPDAEGHFIGHRNGDNPQGKGEDYGFDLNLLEGKIYIRATKFSTTRAGAQQFLYGGSTDNPTVMADRILDALEVNGVITSAERALHQIDSRGSQFDTSSTGYEYSVTANVTKGWRLTANYSVTDSVTSNTAPEIQAWAAIEIPYYQKFDQSMLVSTGTTIGEEIARWQAQNVINTSVNGLATIGNRREKCSLVTRYSFSQGWLKGFHVGATARHQSKNVIAATSSNSLIYGNSFTTTDAFIGYNFGKRAILKYLQNASLQLNVFNVLDQHDPLIMGVASADASPLVINRLRPQEPRYWRLSASFAF